MPHYNRTIYTLCAARASARIGLKTRPLCELSFLPPGHLLPVRDTVTKEGPGAKGKLLRWDRAYDEKDRISLRVITKGAIDLRGNTHHGSLRH